MSNSEEWANPAADVPVVHNFGGFVHTVVFRNRSIVAGAYVDITFPSGGRVRLYAGETFILDAEDTSREAIGDKFWGAQYTTAGDNVNIQNMQVIWTCKLPIGLQGEPVG